MSGIPDNERRKQIYLQAFRRRPESHRAERIIKRTEPIESVIRNFDPPIRTILDAGCGRGVWVEHMAGLGYDIEGTSFIPQEVVCTQRKVYCVAYHELATLLPQRWDAVVSSHVLEHLYTQDEARDAVIALRSLATRVLCIAVGLGQSSYHPLNATIRGVRAWTKFLDESIGFAGTLQEATIRPKNGGISGYASWFWTLD